MNNISFPLTYLTFIFRRDIIMQKKVVQSEYFLAFAPHPLKTLTQTCSTHAKYIMYKIQLSVLCG